MSSVAAIYGEVPLTYTESIPEGQKRAFCNQEGPNYIDATRYAEFGRFQIVLLIVCLIAFSSTSTVPKILSKLSGPLQCEYKLSLDDRKEINNVVYVCMLFGGVAWSFLADLMTRKWTLVCALLVYSISTVGLVLSTRFLSFGFFRGISAFSLSGVACITVVFLAEFQPNRFRGSAICCLQLAYVAAIVVISALSLTWKTKAIIGAVSPTLAAIGLIFFPDSPRFLLSRGQEQAAIRSQQMIYASNTGTNKINFPIRHLTDNQGMIDMRSASVAKPHLESKVFCVFIIMLTQFVLMFSYHTLWMWFPGMAGRSEAFFPVIPAELASKECRFGIYYKEPTVFKGPRSIGANNELIIGNNKLPFATSESVSLPQPNSPCSGDYSKRFDDRSSTLVALASIPPLIFLAVKIDTIGRKVFIAISNVVAGCLVFASYYIQKAGTQLLFSCLFDFVTLVSVAMAHCLAVELFPTRIRVFGVALVVGSGQLGAIFANIGSAASIGLSCGGMVLLMAISLTAVGILAITIPETTGWALR